MLPLWVSSFPWVSNCSVMILVMSVMAFLFWCDGPVIVICVSSLSLGVDVFISTLCRFWISCIVFPFFPTTCFPIPGGMTMIWVLRISTSGLLFGVVSGWLLVVAVSFEVVLGEGVGGFPCLFLAFSDLMALSNCAATRSPPFTVRW